MHTGCGAAWLARLSGGQEVGSSNLPSPTQCRGFLDSRSPRAAIPRTVNRVYDRDVVHLRSMTIDDVALLVRWDDDPDVAAALGGRGVDWYDWSTELARNVPWRELLIVEEDGRPIGFVQLIDAVEEESHHWGDVEPGTWALDIWIGSPDDRGRGLGTAAMEAALKRVVDRHGADTVVIDPSVDNHRAIAFYEQLGFERVGVRQFGDERCLVMVCARPAV